MLYHNVLLGQLKLIIFAGSVVSPDNYYIWKVIIKFLFFFTYVQSQAPVSIARHLLMLKILS